MTNEAHDDDELNAAIEREGSFAQDIRDADQMTTSELCRQMAKRMIMTPRERLRAGNLADPDAHVRVEGSGWTVTARLGDISFEEDDADDVEITPFGEGRQMVTTIPQLPRWSMWAGSSHKYPVDGDEAVTFL